MDIKSYHYIISGRVQGVAFRYYTIKKAHQLSIRGSVKNLSNGDVEVYAQGEPHSICIFESFLEDGPPAAIVKKVTKNEFGSSRNYTNFEIIF